MLKKVKTFAKFTKEYSPKFYVFLLCALVYAVLKLFPFAFVSDLLNIETIGPSDYFYLLTEITASIFGILITVVLLTFQLLKPKALRRKDENILHNQSVSNFVALSTFIIIGSVYSYTSIHDFSTPNNITIAYFLLYLFVSFIILVFPVAVLILNEVNWLKKTEKEIQQLTFKDYQNILPLRFQRFQKNDFQNPLSKIGEELTSAIRDNDNDAVSAILQELNKKTKELIGDGTDRLTTSQLCDALTFIWSNGNAEALRSQNLYYYATVWASIEEIYEYAAQNKILLLHIQDIDSYIYTFIEFLAQNKLSESLTIGVNTLYEAFKVNLNNNCPPQKEISDLYRIFDKGNKVAGKMDSDMQWDHITRLLGHIVRIHRLSIELSEQQLYKSTLRSLTGIINEIEHGSFASMEVFKEAYIVIDLIRNMLYNAQNAMDKGMFKETSETYRIEGRVIAGFISKEKFYAKQVLESISDFIILNQRSERLTYWLTINMWGAIPRHTSKNYKNNKFIREATTFIFSSFVTMKEEIEKNQLPNQLKNYLEIKNQMNALKRTLLEDGNKKSKLLKKIDLFINSFKRIESVPDFKIVKW